MIPSPKLDDRAFDDIVAEAIRLIPRYCPEWTNHNPSDPGITLIELAAWMSDIILYRLNRVPEKNYIAFLNLLGIKLKPPQAARALLTFSLVEQADRQVVREGTQVATPQAADEETITFETTRDLVVTKVKLDRCFAYWNETYSDNSAYILGGGLGAASRPSTAPSAPTATSTWATRASAVSARARCSASSSAAPSTAAATWPASSSGSTGTGRAGRSS
jgi:hypothetical protein